VDRGPTRTLTELLGDLRSLATPAGLWGALSEAAWSATHLAIYPWGLLREPYQSVDRYGMEGLPPVQRGLMVGDIEASGTPILLLHGMADNRAIFAVLAGGLRRRGFRRVLTLNYSPVTTDIRAAARDLSAEVEALVARTGHERIHVVGHSLGGLIARYYVQCLAGHERVHTLVTLGTPHAGTLTAHLVPAALGGQMRPGSDLYAELAAPAPRCSTRFVAYWSDIDHLVLPHRHATVDHPDLAATNIRVRAVGHMSLPIQRSVVYEVAALLSQLDAHGATVQAGVTRLH
jgi:pimeloyl-ACP methyl ester carboxylesterase